MSDIQKIWLVGFGGIAHSIYQHPKLKDVEWTILSTKSHQLPHRCIQIDSTDEHQVNQFVKQQALPDAIIITTGLLHHQNQMPEKSISQCSLSWLEQNIHANVLPTLNFAKAINTYLKPSSKLNMICFSARVGSLGDNRLGGWHSYRMSKAMLNMLIKNIAIEWAVKSHQSTIMGYHPGTVDTPLSKPYQTHVKPQQLFSPQTAADYFYEVFSHMTPNNSGAVLDWQGKVVPA